jgi:lycopene cyclase domain-containing protein
MSLYLAILLLTLIIPLTFSFENNLSFYKRWKSIFLSIFIIGSIYIVFDILFTSKGVWGFNPKYHSKLIIINLPLEEWLFFIIIPYASIFLHYTVLHIFRHKKLNNYLSGTITVLIIILSIFIAVTHLSKLYTVYSFCLLILALTLTFFDKQKTVNSFYITFPIILIPFLLVNAILTGSFSNEPAVWYNNKENLGICMFTIPIEDFGYAFSLIFFNLLLLEKFDYRFSKKLIN